MFQASCYLQVKSYNFKISKVQNLKKKKHYIHVYKNYYYCYHYHYYFIFILMGV